MSLTTQSRPVTDAQIDIAISSMSPCPLGFQPAFYQKWWDKLGPKVREFVKDAFHSGTFDSIMNPSYIAL